MRSLAIAAVALLAVSTTADAKRSSTKPKASAKVAANFMGSFLVVKVAGAGGAKRRSGMY